MSNDFERGENEKTMFLLDFDPEIWKKHVCFYVQ